MTASKMSTRAKLAIILSNVAVLIFLLACLTIRSTVVLNSDGTGETGLTFAVADLDPVLAPYGVKDSTSKADQNNATTKAEAEKAGFKYAPYREQQTGRVGYTLSKGFSKPEEIADVMTAMTKAGTAGSQEQQGAANMYPSVNIAKDPARDKGYILSGGWETKSYKELRDEWDKEKAAGPDKLDLESILGGTGVEPPKDQARAKEMAKAVYNALYTNPPTGQLVVTLPGSITSHNATKKEGNTLTWDLYTGSGKVESKFDWTPGKTSANPTPSGGSAGASGSTNTGGSTGTGSSTGTGGSTGAGDSTSSDESASLQDRFKSYLGLSEPLEPAKAAAAGGAVALLTVLLAMAEAKASVLGGVAAASGSAAFQGPVASGGPPAPDRLLAEQDTAAWSGPPQRPPAQQYAERTTIPERPPAQRLPDKAAPPWRPPSLPDGDRVAPTMRPAADLPSQIKQPQAPRSAGEQGVVCAACGNALPAESKFCNLCGGPAQAPAPQDAPAEEAQETQPTILLCPKCQHQNQPGDRFCNMCGQPLAGV